MATAWTALASVTINTNISTVTFDSISQSYRDLVVFVHSSSQNYGTGFYMKLNNGVAGSVDSYQAMGAGGSTPSAQASASANWSSLLKMYYNGAGYYWAWSAMAQIFDYAQTDKYKNVLSHFAAPATGSYRDSVATINTLGSTSAVSRVDIVAGGQQFVSGATFTLYGISG